jgi:hypothetical protein
MAARGRAVNNYLLHNERQEIEYYLRQLNDAKPIKKRLNLESVIVFYVNKAIDRAVDEALSEQKGRAL